MESTSKNLFSEGPALPEMCEARLNNEELRALGKDLVICTELVSISCKGSARSYTPDRSEIGLDEALSALMEATVHAIQIKYRYQAYEWTDTLMQSPLGVRLVRCRHEES